MTWFSIPGIPSCGAGLRYNHRAIGFSNNIQATITTHLAWWVSIVLYCKMQGSPLGEIVDGFSLPAAYRVPSSTMKTSQQERSFLLSSNLISLCLTPNRRGFFSSWVLPFHSGGHPRAMATGYIVLGVPKASLTDNSQEGIPFLALILLFHSIWLLHCASV